MCKPKQVIRLASVNHVKFSTIKILKCSQTRDISHYLDDGYSIFSPRWTFRQQSYYTCFITSSICPAPILFSKTSTFSSCKKFNKYIPLFLLNAILYQDFHVKSQKEQQTSSKKKTTKNKTKKIIHLNYKPVLPFEALKW